MPIDETTRLRIRQWFIDHMDENLADAIMMAMPPFEWTELATKDDIAAVRADIAALDTNMQREIATLNAGLGSVNDRLTNETGILSAGLRSVNDRLTNEFGILSAGLGSVNDRLTNEFGSFERSLQAEIKLEAARSTRLMVTTTIGAAMANLGGVIAVLSLT